MELQIIFMINFTFSCVFIFLITLNYFCNLKRRGEKYFQGSLLIIFNVLERARGAWYGRKSDKYTTAMAKHLILNSFKIASGNTAFLGDYDLRYTHS